MINRFANSRAGGRFEPKGFQIGDFKWLPGGWFGEFTQRLAMFGDDQGIAWFHGRVELSKPMEELP